MKRWKLTALISMVLVALLLASSVYADDPGPKRAWQSQLVATLENSAIRIVVGELGSPNLGTTGGHPAISGDENKPLLFGYGEGYVAHTTFTSIRAVRDGATTDYKLYDIPREYGPVREGNKIVSRWNLDGLEVIQELSILFNPYTAQNDMMLIETKVKNLGQTPLQAGVRVLLDIKVGGNDQAPFFLPGVGKVDTEAQYSSGSMPEYYKAFEATDFNENSLRSMGLLKGFGITIPDRFVIATIAPGRGGGSGIMETVWDYAITSGVPAGDSATAMYYGPRGLTPGQSLSVKTGYGLGGVGSGEAWIEMPAQLECGEPQFNATVWVSNVRTETLFNGRITLLLPEGLTIVPGQDSTRNFGDLLPKEAHSEVWLLQADMSVPTTFIARARIEFNNLDEPLLVEAPVQIPPCPTATPGPSPTPSETPSVTPTPGVTPTPEVPEPASLLLLTLGLAGLAAGLRRKRG